MMRNFRYANIKLEFSGENNSVQNDETKCKIYRNLMELLQRITFGISFQVLH